MIKPHLLISNSPETAVPSGNPVVTVISDVLRVTNKPLQTNRWYGRPVMKATGKYYNGKPVWICCYANSEAHHLLTWSQLHVIFSNDYGETWTDENKYIDGSDCIGTPIYPPSCVPGENTRGPGDGWIMVCPNGDLLIHMWDSNYDNLNYGTYQTRSTDGGKTWSTPSYIEWQNTSYDSDHIFSTDDDFVKDGVIYIGARRHPLGNQLNGTHNLLMKSIDNGDSWSYVSDITNITTNPTNEVGIEYTGNNSIVAIVRGTNSLVNGGPYKISYLIESVDLGVNWGSISNPENLQVNGRIRIKSRSHVKGKNNWWNDPVLIAHGFDQQSVPSSANRRICIYISKDFGVSWSEALYLKLTGYDGGYGDFLYNPIKDEYVTIQYNAPTSLYDGEVRQINWKLTFE